MGDGGALALRSARQEQHDGAGASPAGAAARVPGGARLAFHSSTSRSEPRALAPRRPGTGAWRQPVITSGLDLSCVLGPFDPQARRQRVRQPGPSTDSVPAGYQDSGEKDS